MPEDNEIVEIPLGEASMADFKKARTEGKEVVTQKTAPVEEKVADEEEIEEKPKIKGGFQKRIDRLIKHQADLEDQLSKAREEAQTKVTGKTDEKKADPNAEPQRDQFDTEVAYIRALTRWEVKQEMKAEREAGEKEAQAAQQKELIASYNKKAIEASSRYDDWKEVMAQETPLPSIVGDAIVFTIKNGPDVAYFLGKNPEICQEMLTVHPLEAVAMAVKISEQLLKPGEAESEEKEEESDEDAMAPWIAEEKEPEKKIEPEKAKSKAPTPIKPVSGGTTRSTIPLDKTDFSAYKKLRSQGRVQ